MRDVRQLQALGWAALAGAVALGAVRRMRLVARISPDLRSPSDYVPLSVTNRAALRVQRCLLARKTVVRPGVAAHEITVRHDGVEVRAMLYHPEAMHAGALLWIHGGGLVAGRTTQDHDWCSRVAQELGALVLSPEYRLAPEHPFPAALDDCNAALRWLHSNAVDLGVNSARIAVGGASAGGGLAAALCQLAYDHDVPVAFQLLEYPMLDDRTVLRRDHPARGCLAWTARSNRFAWTSYLGRRPGEQPPPYAAAARREDLAGLAPAWIGVGELDLFYAEDVTYAHRLRQAGVSCELVTIARMHHGADLSRPEAPAMADLRGRMIASLADAIIRG